MRNNVHIVHNVQIVHNIHIVHNVHIVYNVHIVHNVHNVHILHNVHIHKNTLKESEFVLRNCRFTTQSVSEINKNFKRKGVCIL